MLRNVRKSPPKIATVLRSVSPDESQEWFDARMRAALKGTPAAWLSSEDLAKLYAKYGIDKFNLNDRGYIASVHPLELWTVNYLRNHPLATRRRYSGSEPRCARHRVFVALQDALSRDAGPAHQTHGRSGGLRCRSASRGARWAIRSRRSRLRMRRRSARRVTGQPRSRN